MSSYGTMDEEVPRLNLRLRKTPEFLAKIESILKKDYPCPHQKILPDSSKTSKSLETTKSLEKKKAINFQATKITIGQWTHKALFQDDIKAKFYFAKKKLIWEILENVETRTKVTPMLKKKIEIQWADVLSLKRTFHSDDNTGTLEIELGERPKFFMEINPQPGKHTQWKKMDHDFTLNQSASKCRRHTLHFAAGVLQKNFQKILCKDSFWPELIKVNFPVLPPWFDIGYDKIINNNYSSINLFRYGQCQTLSSNVNNNVLRYDPQGLGHVPDGEVNFNMATKFCANDGRQMNSFVQDNGQNKTMNQLLGTQVTQPSSQLINRGSYFSRSQLYNPMIQDERKMINTRKLRRSQALFETRTNDSMVYPHMNEVSTDQVVRSYLQGYLDQEGETQNMEH